MRVILVDDAADVRRLERFVLNDGGVEVVAEASSPAEALAAAAELHPDAVVVDLRMPEGSGIELIPRLVGVAPDARIVVYSALAAPGLDDRLRAAGAHVVVHKGSGPQALLEALTAG